MTLLADITRRARRASSTSVWRCYWCHQYIKNGEVYREQRLVEDGLIGTARGHIECYHALCRSDRDPEEPITSAQPRGMTWEEKEGV